MKIGVIGCGYVGMAYIALLANSNKIVGYDNNKEKIEKLKNNSYFISEKNLVNKLKKHKNNIEYRIYNKKTTFKDEEIIFVCVPTNYNEKSNSLNCNILNEVICDITKKNKNALIVIKSTIPVGYTDSIINLTKNENIVFMPEFLREGSSYLDLKNAERVVLGASNKFNDKNLKLIKKLLVKRKTFFKMSTKEAESVKLFANSYLAMRIAFFNELDNFAMANNLKTKNIIDGICADSRIGNYYNNPSFAFGGYCLEKDTMQCSLLCKENILIKNICISNLNRKQIMLNKILKLLKENKGSTVGIYKLEFKKNSDNTRNSVMLDLLENLIHNNVKVIIYDEKIEKNKYCGCKVEKDFQKFILDSNIIIANRLNKKLKGLNNVFSRDVFGIN